MCAISSDITAGSVDSIVSGERVYPMLARSSVTSEETFCVLRSMWPPVVKSSLICALVSLRIPSSENAPLVSSVFITLFF